MSRTKGEGKAAAGGGSFREGGGEERSIRGSRRAGGTDHDPAGGRTEPSTAKTPRRGRPPGSVSLTPQIQDTILNYIRAGAMAYVAAEAAGISERTFRDWMERGEGRHATRKPTPKLRRFAREVRRAQAEARVAAEVRAHQEDLRFWLGHVARSRPGREGWTQPVGGGAEGEEEATTFDARAVLAAKLEAIAARTVQMQAEEQGRARTQRPGLRVVRDVRTSEKRRRGKPKEAT